MKNRKKLLLTGLVLAIGIQLTAANPNEVLRKAREDYYRQQKNELNAKEEAYADLTLLVSYVKINL